MKSLHLAPKPCLAQRVSTEDERGLGFKGEGGGLCRKSRAAQKPNTINNHPIRLAKWTS